MSCPRCGSWSVRRDRSLAGRMVCARCSLPLGPGIATTARRGFGRMVTGSRGGSPARWRWALPLALLLAAGAHLAWLSGPTGPAAPPFRGDVRVR